MADQATPTPQTVAAPAAPAASPNGLPDDLFGGVGAAQAGQGDSPAPVTSPPAPTPAGPAQGQPAGNVGAPEQATPPPGTIDPAQLANPASLLDTLKAVGTGAAKGVFAAKDFFVNRAGLWGSEIPENQRSGFRQTIDQYSDQQSKKWGAGYSFAEGVGQVGIGLLGGELGGAGALGAIGRTAVDTLANVATFEPHAQNFANLASQVPGLNGPITQFLSSSPNDSDAMGYVKNALTSLGLTTTLVGAFVGSAAMIRALKSGDSAAISSASAELEKAIGEHVQGTYAPKEGEQVSPWQAQEPSSSPSEGSTSPSTPSEQPSTASTEQPPAGAPAQGETPASGPDLSSPSASSPSSPTASPTSSPGGFSLDEEQFSRFIEGANADQDALLQHGGWDEAISAGHTFASDDRLPWQIIGGTNNAAQGETALDAFIARAAEAYQEPLDAAKGGAVQTDAATQRAVNLRVQLWGQDQASLLGQLQSAGARAGDLRADMMGGFTVAQKLLQDAWTLSQRIKLGDLSEFSDSASAAEAALKSQMVAAMQAFGAANSIRSNVGRAMRGLTSQFKLDPEVIRNVASMDHNDLMNVLDATQGDPRALAKVAEPGWVSRVVEGAQLFLVNNLISSPLTHTIIAASNLWQTGARPLMRAAGAAATGTFDTVGREAMSQLAYLPSVVGDAWNSAVQAFKVGDSIIAPHDLSAAQGEGAGGSMVASGLGQAISQLEFKPWDSVPNILYNVLTAGAKTGIFPTRMVGFQDELVKQVVYRSVIQAKALSIARQMGLAGEDAAQFVKDKLYSAFDEFGRGTDPASLQEAKIATYQNDLNPTGNFGWATMGAKGQQMLQNNPPARVIIPFMRTPVNLFRQSVQLTPGLNLLQQEYRQMLSGAMGETARAQAVGQMGMGSLLMGALGTLAHQGYVTGDAPDNGRLKAEALQDGWKPNSLVIPHEDGSRTYVPYDRWDPIMLPMAMAANIVSVLQQPDVANQNKAQSMLAALGVTLVHQLTNKLYLQNMQKTLEMIQDPEHNIAKWAGGMAGNYVPYSSLLHLVNPDPYLREADGFISSALSKLPGYSEQFTPRRDWAGDAITVHKGLWANVPGSAANDEMNRLAMQQGGSIGPPSSKAQGGIDLRGLTMTGDRDPESAGRDAYDRYQELAGHPAGQPSLRSAIEKLVGDPRYQALPDGASQTPGTKLSVLLGIVHTYRQAAMQQVSADKAVRAAETEELRRVSVARGQAAPPNPTPTNTLTRMVKQLGARVGLGGLAAPAPVQTGGQ